MSVSHLVFKSINYLFTFKLPVFECFKYVNYELKFSVLSEKYLIFYEKVFHSTAITNGCQSLLFSNNY